MWPELLRADGKMKGDFCARTCNAFLTRSLSGTYRFDLRDLLRGTKISSLSHFKCSHSMRKTSAGLNRKSTRLNSSHLVISYAVFCLHSASESTDTCYSFSSLRCSRVRPPPQHSRSPVRSSLSRKRFLSAL